MQNFGNIDVGEGCWRRMLVSYQHYWSQNIHVESKSNISTILMLKNFEIRENLRNLEKFHESVLDRCKS